MADPSSLKPEPARAILSALNFMAEQSQLGDVQWREWFSRLPREMQTTPEGAGLMVHTGSRQASEFVSEMLLGCGEADVEACLIASMAAYGEENFPSASRYLKRAFELDLSYTLRQCVMRYSAQTARILGATRTVDEMSSWLTEHSKDNVDFTLMPATFGRKSILVSRRLRQKALDRGLPSPILITQGKSASVSVAAILASGFGLPTVLYALLSQRVIGPWLTEYLRGGACYTTHLDPSQENVGLLLKGGAAPIIVHVRDPRQQVVSLMEHYRRYPNQREGSLRTKPESSDESDLHELIAGRLLSLVRWIEGWVSASDDLNINFTTFEEFVTDRDRFLDRILSFYGGDTRYFDKAAATTEQAAVDYHRRIGSVDEWRTRLSASQIEEINAAVPNLLWDRFGWRP